LDAVGGGQTTAGRRSRVGVAAKQRVPVADGWELLIRVVVVVNGQADLFEVVATLDAGGCFANLLDGRQQETNQDGDDGDDDKQLDQGEAFAAHGIPLRSLKSTSMHTFSRSWPQ